MLTSLTTTEEYHSTDDFTDDTSTFIIEEYDPTTFTTEEMDMHYDEFKYNEEKDATTFTTEEMERQYYFDEMKETLIPDITMVSDNESLQVSEVDEIVLNTIPDITMLSDNESLQVSEVEERVLNTINYIQPLDSFSDSDYSLEKERKEKCDKYCLNKNLHRKHKDEDCIEPEDHHLPGFNYIKFNCKPKKFTNLFLNPNKQFIAIQNVDFPYINTDPNRNKGQRGINDDPQRKQAILDNKKSRSRIRYSNETEEQRQDRVDASRRRARKRYSDETEEVKQDRLNDSRRRDRERYTNETEQERQDRLDDLRRRARIRYSNETEEERQDRLDDSRRRDRERYANETEEERQDRVDASRRRARKIYNNETDEEKLTRLDDMRKRTKEKRNNETDEKRQARLDRMKKHAGDMRNEINKTKQWRSWWLPKDISKFDENSIKPHYLGKMTKKCKDCAALLFESETCSLCCNKGQTKLPVLPQPPPELIELCEGKTTESKWFKKYSKQLNHSFAFTSISCNDQTIRKNKAPIFQINGMLFIYFVSFWSFI